MTLPPYGAGEPPGGGEKVKKMKICIEYEVTQMAQKKLLRDGSPARKRRIVEIDLEGADFFNPGIIVDEDEEVQIQSKQDPTREWFHGHVCLYAPNRRGRRVEPLLAFAKKCKVSKTVVWETEFSDLLTPDAAKTILFSMGNYDAVAKGEK